MMNKPRDVQVYPIASDTMAIRSRTWDRLKFEIEYGLILILFKGIKLL